AFRRSRCSLSHCRLRSRSCTAFSLLLFLNYSHDPLQCIAANFLTGASSIMPVFLWLESSPGSESPHNNSSNCLLSVEGGYQLRRLSGVLSKPPDPLT